MKQLVRRRYRRFDRGLVLTTLVALSLSAVPVGCGGATDDIRETGGVPGGGGTSAAGAASTPTGGRYIADGGAASVAGARTSTGGRTIISDGDPGDGDTAPDGWPDHSDGAAWGDGNCCSDGGPDGGWSDGAAWGDGTIWSDGSPSGTDGSSDGWYSDGSYSDGSWSDGATHN